MGNPKIYKLDNDSKSVKTLAEDTNSRIGVDWLAFTYLPDMSDIGMDPITGLYRKYFNCQDKFRKCCPEMEFLFQDTFQYDYSRAHYDFTFGFGEGCAYMYDSDHYEKGFNVSIPGHAVEWFMNSFKPGITLHELFSYFSSHNISLSRIDIAFDDFTMKYRPEDLDEWNRNNLLHHKFKTYALMGQSCKGNRYVTFYLGKRNGDKFFRCYDKEHQSKGEVKSIRYEFEMHRLKATDFMLSYLASDGYNWLNLFTDFFEVLSEPVPKNNRHRDRLKFNEEWNEFLITSLMNTKEMTYIHYNPKQTVESKKNWVSRAYPTIRMLIDSGNLTFDDLQFEIFNIPIRKDQEFWIKNNLKPEWTNCDISEVFNDSMVYNQISINDVINYRK